MTVFLTLEVILCLSSNVFWEKLKLFMTFPVPSGKPWVCSKGFFPGATEGFLRMRFTLCPLWIMALLKLPGGLGVEGFCDISVYIPPEEEALSLSCQASSIKGMNWWRVPTPPHLSITYIAVYLSSVACKASLGSVLQGWDEPCCLGQRPAPTALFLYQKNLFRPLLCVLWSLFYGFLSGGCESNSNCAFFLHLLSYKSTNASFSGDGAESAVVVDGDGARCRAALYKFHLLIMHLRHQGCTTVFKYSLLWEVLPVFLAQGTYRNTWKLPHPWHFLHWLLPELELCLQNERWFFLSPFQAAFACFLLLEHCFIQCPERGSVSVFAGCGCCGPFQVWSFGSDPAVEDHLQMCQAELIGQGWGSGHTLTFVNMELGGVLFESKLTLFSGARAFSSVNILGTCKMTDWKNVCPAFVFEQDQENGSKHCTNLIRV